ncbi:MAG: hypothetical protein IIZ67_06815 [Bacilli bacterium]|nr:hypothetical protein [Bacilli bacterium]
MKKILKIFIIFTLLFSFSVNAKEKVTLYFFHGDGCPHCAEEQTDLIDDLKKDSSINVEEIEVWHDSENKELLDKVISAYGSRSGVPYNVIGDTTIIGYSESNGEKIKRAIEYYKTHEYTDEIKKIKNGETVQINDQFSKEEEKTDQEQTIDVPIIGKVNLKNISIMSAAVLIGLVDGFNPCAMWVLLFLITTLISLKDKKRLLLLGSIFLLTSGFVYFLIMFSWLNIVVSVSTSIIFRYLIGVFAIGAGIYNLYNFLKGLKSDDGCEVVDKKKRKDIFKKIKKFTHEKSLLLAILGIMLLAVSVNIVELLCSAGLPLIFSELLLINNVTGVKAIGYDLIYIIFFMLDDFIVFIIALKTLDVVGVSTKFNKYSHLIGGLIMLLIGILLLVNPGALMFNL